MGEILTVIFYLICKSRLSVWDYSLLQHVVSSSHVTDHSLTLINHVVIPAITLLVRRLCRLVIWVTITCRLLPCNIPQLKLFLRLTIFIHFNFVTETNFVIFKQCLLSIFGLLEWTDFRGKNEDKQSCAESEKRPLITIVIKSTPWYIYDITNKIKLKNKAKHILRKFSLNLIGQSLRVLKSTICYAKKLIILSDRYHKLGLPQGWLLKCGLKLLVDQLILYLRAQIIFHCLWMQSMTFLRMLLWLSILMFLQVLLFS